QPFTLSGNAASEGHLTRSMDGTSLVIAGYAATPGSSDPSGSSATAVNRVIAHVTAGQVFDTKTPSSDGYTTNQIRSAACTGSRGLWVSGAGTGTGNGSGGTRYLVLGSTSGTTTLISTAPTDTNVVGIFDGQLYASSSSGNNKGVNIFATQLPSS